MRLLEALEQDGAPSVPAGKAEQKKTDR
jgi:hypothetical protein